MNCMVDWYANDVSLCSRCMNVPNACRNSKQTCCTSAPNWNRPISIDLRILEINSSGTMRSCFNGRESNLMWNVSGEAMSEFLFDKSNAAFEDVDPSQIFCLAVTLSQNTFDSQQILFSESTSSNRAPPTQTFHVTNLISSGIHEERNCFVVVDAQRWVVQHLQLDDGNNSIEYVHGAVLFLLWLLCDSYGRKLFDFR